MRRALLALTLSVVVSGSGLLLAATPASATLPPGYVPVPGTVPINPAHIGAVGSQFTQLCVGLPRPVQPGEVAWHFILPQSVARAGTPVNVFNTLTVTFQSAGPITLSAVTDFGPPSNAHAYVFTPTDDTLTAGNATIGREIAADPLIANDPQFNLSHTCASQLPPPTTTTTTSTTTTTTSTTVPTTTGPSTSTTIAAMTTTASTGTSPTSTGGAVGPASTSQLPGTGGNGGLPVAAVGVAALIAGSVLVLTVRRWTRTIATDDT